jgi:hypothetical protein
MFLRLVPEAQLRSGERIPRPAQILQIAALAFPSKMVYIFAGTGPWQPSGTACHRPDPRINAGGLNECPA